MFVRNALFSLGSVFEGRPGKLTNRGSIPHAPGPQPEMLNSAGCRCRAQRRANSNEPWP